LLQGRAKTNIQREKSDFRKVTWERRKGSLTGAGSENQKIRKARKEGSAKG